MNISTLLDTRAKFMSRLESIDSTNLLNETTFSMSCTAHTIEDLNGEPWGMNLKFQNLKQLYLYFLGVHSLEPIFGKFNELVDLNRLLPTVSYTFSHFTNLTTIDLHKTLLFRPLKFTDDMLLAYQDFAYQGERSVYKPFGHTSNKAIDTKITADISSVKRFFKQHFKFANLKGKATFTLSSYFKKGSIIELTDRKIFLVVTSANLKDAGIVYEALVALKG